MFESTALRTEYEFIVIGSGAGGDRLGAGPPGASGRRDLVFGICDASRWLWSHRGAAIVASTTTWLRRPGSAGHGLRR